MIPDVPKTRWAKTVDGLYIAYQDFGEGPDTVVFINGMYSHIEIYWEWPQVARFFNRLAGGARVLHFDRRGTGLSDRFTARPTLESRMDDVLAVMDAAGVERAALYAWGTGAPALAVLFAATYPERTSALLIDGWLALRWAPDYPLGESPEEWGRFIGRMKEIWGDDEHALEIGHLTCGDRPEDGPWDDREFLLVHSKLARYAATPGSFEAFEWDEFDTDVRDVAPQVHVPTAILVKEGNDTEELEAAAYNASLIPGARLLTLPGVANIPMFDEADAYVDAMHAFLAAMRREEAELDRVLATVLFTDIVGSTDKACEVGDACWKDLLERHASVTRAMLARYRGLEVKTTGDGFLATFDGPARAAKCARAICAAVQTLGLEIRAGCHTGEIEVMGADVGGVAVHIAARVSALAGPSEVLVSSTVKDLVAGSGLDFEDRGEHTLKGVPEKWRLYAVTSAL